MTRLNFFRRAPVEEQLPLRERISRQLRLILSAGFLVLALIALAFTWFFEINLWEARQQSTAQTAANLVRSYLEQVDDLFFLLVSLENTQDLVTFEDRIFSERPYYLEFIRLDKTGNVIWNMDRMNQPLLGNLFTVRQSSWFIQAPINGYYLSDVQLTATGEPYLIYSRATGNGDIIAIRLGMSFLWNIMVEQAELLSGNVYMVNSAGLVIAHPKGAAAFLQPIGSYEFRQAMSAPEEFFSGYYRDFENVNVFGVSAPVPNTNWLIFTEIPANTTRLGSFVAFFVLGAAFVLILYLTTRFTSQMLQRLVLEPLETLQEGVTRIGQGDLTYQVDLQTGDEFSDVAREFNTMAARLNQREVALVQARDEAITANRFKTQLLANVSHDLRTPLNGILGFADILQEGVYGPMNERQVGAVERILGNTNRLIMMVNNLLDEAQIEAGKIKLELQPFSPGELIHEIDGVMHILAQQKGLTYQSEVEAQLPRRLVGDRQRLFQLVTNLAHNAIKFTENGGVRIRMYRSDETHWAISVIDTGIGIAEEDQKKIFHPFQQLDGSTTRRSGGVGLGLSIVQHLTELMGGKIELDSVLGKGSTFTVILPVILPEEPKK